MAEKIGKPKVLESKRSSPLQSLVRIALTLLVLYLIFGVLIPEFADYAEIWDAIQQLDVAAAAGLVGLVLIIESLKSTPPVILIHRLGLRQSFLAQETSALISNTVPGPSGTASRYVTYRRFGLTTEDFGRSTIVNGLWNNAIVLLLPTAAIGLLATQRDIPGKVLVLVLAGLVITLAGIVVAGLILHSEAFARRIGAGTGRTVNWARGLAKQEPSPQDYAQAVVDFRFDLRDSIQRHWLGLTSAIATKEITTFVVLLLSLRAVGAGRITLTAIDIFAVYAFVRLLTIIEITPGGVGVTEALYISSLMWASGGAAENEIVGGVFLFRMFTYLGPILLGMACWPVLGRMLRRADAAQPTT
ncbi:YbhN family protein [Spirillospora sp. NPDC048911]|uniref:lysylphosphatidylglycerol synthase transmembrane domain-containing protein n=1 Tax=Spirillospora sp. NPDC048911 TaxID=3364527 RepID=UPI003721E1AA